MNLNLYSPIGYTGYGITGLNILKSLTKLGVNVTLFTPTGTKPRLDSQQDADLVQSCLNAQNSFDYDAPFLKLWHQFDLAGKIGNGHYIAFPIFELDNFNDREKHHLNFPDDLFVTSQWANKVVKNITGRDSHIIHLGVDDTVFKPISMNTGKCVFLNVGKWEVRKGHDVLIETFNQGFKEEDNVELWMVPFNNFLKPEEEAIWHNRVKTSKLRDKIKIFPRQETQYKIAELMNMATCGVFLSRAEGWNLEALEMMACGKPIIITNYSAHTEFCFKENSMLVDIDSVEPAYDGKWFFEQGNWASINEKQKNQVLDYMHDIYNKFCTFGVPTNTSGLETAKNFSWRNSAKQIYDYLGRC